MIYCKLYGGIDTSEEGDFIITFGIVDGRAVILSQKRAGESKKDIFKQTPQSAIEEPEPHEDDERI